MWGGFRYLAMVVQTNWQSRFWPMSLLRTTQNQQFQRTRMCKTQPSLMMETDGSNMKQQKLGHVFCGSMWLTVQPDVCSAKTALIFGCHGWRWAWWHGRRKTKRPMRCWFGRCPPGYLVVLPSAAPGALSCSQWSSCWQGSGSSLWWQLRRSWWWRCQLAKYNMLPGDWAIWCKL